MKKRKYDSGIDQGAKYEDYASKLGIFEWFHKDDYTHVENVIADLKNIGINELRTGLSWADFHTHGGREWFDWLIPKLSESFNLLPFLVFTPPSLGIESNVISPPAKPKLFADFVDVVINRYGDHFDYIEFWNEPNNITSYNYRLDPMWNSFVEMIIMASHWAQHLGKKTVLGGMSPIDPFWLTSMANRNLLKYLDVVGVHGFPKTFDAIWSGWYNEISKVKDVLSFYESNAEIWITETGYSTWKHDEQNQVSKFIEAIKSPVNKVYWSSMYDLLPKRSAADGFHQDERKYHFGMKRADGFPKLLFRSLRERKLEEIINDDLFVKPVLLKPQSKKGILITGGAGFIGTNLADRLLSDEKRVIIYDNLSRPGVENNLKWLTSKHPNVEVMIADTKDFYSLKKAVSQADHVFHFAAQVAVTSSLIYPQYDFEVNVGGTINLLESIRLSSHKPSLIFTSTNKVYGDLYGIELDSNESRYFPVDLTYLKNGVSENHALNFHSPYGSSKGAADQYVLDYARSFGLRNVVFRMSCIYGPHQFGTEDQGWVAHFIRQSMNGKKIILYGDGKQVRDILYVDDLVNAFLLAKQQIKQLSGEAFNIGGGPENAISLIELLNLMNDLDHLSIDITFDKWRTGDQKYYVSDTRKFKKMAGWQSQVSYLKGLRNLYNWISEYHESQMEKV